MKKRFLQICAIGAAFLCFAAGCSLVGSVGPAGEAAFSMDLAYPMSVGYEVTRVQVVLEHQGSGVTVEEDLVVDAAGTQAQGIVGDLRIGTWNLTVILYESGAEIGSGSAVVTILPDQTVTVELTLSLLSGSLEVIVYWDPGEVPDYVGVWFGENLDFTYVGGVYNDGRMFIGAEGSHEFQIYELGTSTLVHGFRGTCTEADGVFYTILTEEYSYADGAWIEIEPVSAENTYSISGDTMTLNQDWDSDGTVDTIWTFIRE